MCAEFKIVIADGLIDQFLVHRICNSQTVVISIFNCHIEHLPWCELSSKWIFGKSKTIIFSPPPIEFLINRILPQYPINYQILKHEKGLRTAQTLQLFSGPY